jgi:hypothetical protein
VEEWKEELGEGVREGLRARSARVSEKEWSMRLALVVSGLECLAMGVTRWSGCVS